MCSDMSFPIGSRIVLGTHNLHKIAGLQEALQTFPIETVSARELRLPMPEETGQTVIENAVIKALAVARITGLPAVSDDSGFCISEIGDQPGAAAIDWTGPDRNFDLAIARIGHLLEIAGKSSSKARFVSCIALARPDGKYIFELGETHGHLVWPPRGNNQDYLSIFSLPGKLQSVAETSATDPSACGHHVASYGHRMEATHRLFQRVIFGME